MSCINLVYDDVQAYSWLTPTQNFLGFFGTCHVTVWTWNIPRIYLVYTKHMICPNHHVAGTEKPQKVLSRCMPGICLNIIIYQVYA